MEKRDDPTILNARNYGIEIRERADRLRLVPLVQRAGECDPNRESEQFVADCVKSLLGIATRLTLCS